MEIMDSSVETKREFTRRSGFNVGMYPCKNENNFEIKHDLGTTKDFIGGFLLLKAEDLKEAVSIIQTSPIYESNGYAEIREMYGDYML